MKVEAVYPKQSPTGATITLENFDEVEDLVYIMNQYLRIYEYGNNPDVPGLHQTQHLARIIKAKLTPGSY